MIGSNQKAVDHRYTKKDRGVVVYCLIDMWLRHNGCWTGCTHTWSKIVLVDRR